MSITPEQIACIISVISVIVLAFQIRSEIKLNRYNRTFEAINNLEAMLNKSENSKIIEKIKLMDDFSERVKLEEAMDIYKIKKYRRKIYEILNFYEALSLSVFSKHIDEGILKNMAGSRIYNAYEKLYPFISIIADHYETPESKPYQHYQHLYNRWNKYYGGKR